MAAERCLCGHDLAAHTGSGVAGRACKRCLYTRLDDCPGWRPVEPREEVTDARDQVGLEDTASAVAEVEATADTAGPPDLDHAIHAAVGALMHEPFNLHPDGGEPIARAVLEAAAPVLLQATRDQLADLQGRHDDLAGTIRDWQIECIRLERERDDARDRHADLEKLLWAYVAEHDAIQPWEWAERFRIALDVPAAQEEGG